MNKYEKLKQAKSNWYGELKRTIGIENVKTLEELLELHTPKKVKRVGAWPHCPNCDIGLFGIHNFCKDCGKALSWSDDNE